jgi:hypothetical protein
MTGKINLIIGSCAHLSASATEEQFEELYSTKLKPFITALSQYPKISSALYYSGTVFSRLEQKKPEFFILIKHLAARKQLEILGGGFYEPLLPLLPQTDKIGQIEMFTTYIRQNFGRKPQGCVLSHSGWEQSLVGVLNACGMAYTFLSEEQFAAASAENIFSPVYTEDQGKLLVIFPVYNSLSFAMGKNGVSSVLKAYRQENNAEASLITVSPEFPQENAESKIKAFFEDLNDTITNNTGLGFSLELTTPGRVYRSSYDLPRIYFPSSGDSQCPHPRAFLSRQSLANELYGGIYFVNNLINQFRGDKSRKRAAREELWKAQESYALVNKTSQETLLARKHAYRALLASERIIREKEFKPFLLSLDLNLDGIAEYLFQDKNINCYVRLKGASIFEFDYLSKGWNYLSAFPDCRSHYAFRDMLLPGDFIPSDLSAIDDIKQEPEKLFAKNPSTAIRFCGDEEYRLESSDRIKLKADFILPPRKGIPFGSIEIQKNYQIEKNSLRLSYTLTNKGEEKTVLCFIPRFDLSLAGNEILFRKSQGEEERSAEKNGAVRRMVSLEEQETKQGAISVNFQSPCDLYYYPVEFPAKEKKQSLDHQSLCFFPVFQLFLNPGDSWENQIMVSVSAKARSAK